MRGLRSGRLSSANLEVRDLVGASSLRGRRVRGAESSLRAGRRVAGSSSLRTLRPPVGASSRERRGFSVASSRRVRPDFAGISSSRVNRAGLVLTVFALVFLPLVALDFLAPPFAVEAFDLPALPTARSFCNLRARGLLGLELDADIIDP